MGGYSLVFQLSVVIVQLFLLCSAGTVVEMAVSSLPLVFRIFDSHLSLRHSIERWRWISINGTWLADVAQGKCDDLPDYDDKVTEDHHSDCWRHTTISNQYAHISEGWKDAWNTKVQILMVFLLIFRLSLRFFPQQPLCINSLIESGFSVRDEDHSTNGGDICIWRKTRNKYHFRSIRISYFSYIWKSILEIIIHRIAHH